MIAYELSVSGPDPWIQLYDPETGEKLNEHHIIQLLKLPL